MHRYVSRKDDLRKQRGAWGRDSTSRTVVLRIAAMAFGFLANAVAIRAITSGSGQNGFALYALIISVSVALPFADLGTGAAVVNATADYAAGLLSRAHFRAFLHRALAFNAASATSLLGLAVVLYRWRSWGFVLGDFSANDSAQLTVSAVVAVLALCVPLSVGARVLQGLGLSGLMAMWGLATPLMQLTGVLILSVSMAGPASFAWALVTATLLTSLGLASSAWRRLSRLKPEPTPDQHRQANLRSLVYQSLPYLLTLASSAVAFQSQRIVLINVSSPAAVAEYSLVAQFVIPAVALLVFASQNLWSNFRRAMHTGGLSATVLRRQIWLFGSLGFVLAIGTTGAEVLFARPISSGEVQLSASAVSLGAIFVLLNGVYRPLAMMLSTTQGLWAQGASGVAAAGISLTLTMLLGSKFGAAGAFAAGAIALMLGMVLPLGYFATRLVSAPTRQLPREPAAYDGD